MKGMRLVGALAVGLAATVAGAENVTRNPEWRSRLPRPVYDAKREYLELYDRAWELAHQRVDELPGLPAPRYMDEAHRSDRIWIWDTCFMVHFCKYCPEEFPGIESLENFYRVLLPGGVKQLPKVRGNRWCEDQEGQLLDFSIHHADNPPLFAWTEYVYALQTGDRARLEKVYSENRWLQRWYEYFDSFDPSAPPPFGSVCRVLAKKHRDGYSWGGCQSGMDNTPRGRRGDRDPGPASKSPDDPQVRWIDALAQQGLSALYMARIAELLGKADEAAEWHRRYEAAKETANRLYWDETDGFYYDIRANDLAKVKVPTIASYWPVLAEMADARQRERMFAQLEDDARFGGLVPTPSLARSDADFDPEGGYWRGSVWLPTTYMTLKALDAGGEYARARQTALKLVEHLYRTYREFEPHTIWECYSPTAPKPATGKRSGKFVRPDFCGWSALGPISIFLEDVIGIKSANAFTRTLVCDFERRPQGRVGVTNYRFGDIVCSVIATTAAIEVESSGAFTLVADGRQLTVKPGKNIFTRTNELEWISGRDLPMEGKAFADTERLYQRLGKEWVKKIAPVNAGMISLGRHSSGLSFRFSTDSDEITFKWSLVNPNLSTVGMSTLVVSGLDIYEYDEARGWRYYPDWRFAQPRNYPTEPRQVYTIKWKPGRACWVYLPLYNELGEDFAIGIKKGCTVKPLPPRASGIVKPVVFYGSSITQGADAGRPGIGFVNLAGREGDFPIVNLGFSGSARNEDVVYEMLSAIDASCYVIDSLGNTRPGAQYEKALRWLRSARPEVPIVLSGYTGVASEYAGWDAQLGRLFAKLKAEDPVKWSRLYYLSTADQVASDGEDTNDGCHPNSWGMIQIGRKYASFLPKIIGESRK